jgi:hypothetical protein
LAVYEAFSNSGRKGTRETKEPGMAPGVMSPPSQTTIIIKLKKERKEKRR